MSEKKAEISKKIEEMTRAIQAHQNNILRIERERNDRLREFGSLIHREQGEIERLQKQISDLKRQLL